MQYQPLRLQSETMQGIPLLLLNDALLFDSRCKFSKDPGALRLYLALKSLNMLKIPLDLGASSLELIRKKTFYRSPQAELTFLFLESTSAIS